MPRHEQPPGGGRDESPRAAQAHADLEDQLARVRQEVLSTRDRTLRIAADIAVTEQRLAATLRLMAERARADGRARDAERLARHADEAERFAATEELRVEQG